MKRRHLLTGVIAMASSLFGAACTPSSANVSYKDFPYPAVDVKADPTAGPQTAVLAGGCFWCTEGVYEHIPGVISVKSGYAGGSANTANYEAVCGGDTGHAESIEITYDPTKVTYGGILRAFFAVAHNPTELNHQGPDYGTQYRSAIFYANDEQKSVADAYIKQLTAAKVYDKPIVTTLEPLKAFYPAEDYHQGFVRRNPTQGYVAARALPEIAEARKYAQELNAMPATQPAAVPAK